MQVHGWIDKSLRIKPVEVEDFLGEFYQPVLEESMEYTSDMIKRNTRQIDRNLSLGRNRRLVTDEPVEFEKWPIGVHHQDCRKITDHFRGIYGIMYLKINLEKTKDVNM